MIKALKKKTQKSKTSTLFKPFEKNNGPNGEKVVYSNSWWGTLEVLFVRKVYFWVSFPTCQKLTAQASVLTSWDWDFLIQLAPRAGEVNVQCNILNLKTTQCLINCLQNYDEATLTPGVRECYRQFKWEQPSHSISDWTSVCMLLPWGEIHLAA